jgi:hypothetical protein
MSVQCPICPKADTAGGFRIEVAVWQYSGHATIFSSIRCSRHTSLRSTPTWAPRRSSASRRSARKSCHSFVLAYIPESYLFDVEEGQKVAVKARGQMVVGYIEKVLPVTEALPPEFQLPNKTRGRYRLYLHGSHQRSGARLAITKEHYHGDGKAARF